ncbi:lantibiotic dehydratase C-terminal domain-containing protein [Actinomadura oligospora]|uniref:lantibiotic dehydratase C-terminal domain-containing protein n=1 Tax=Actinomadura oligospora TaxID=111804 RepID=UPI00047B54B3|nr:lantibiotic dehydratase C-terminal domain-containing protein [Actinomadura oligospora]
MTENRWVSAHAFYQGDQDHLLVNAVAPLTAELTAEGRAHGWFFLRYWDGGPHVRLRVLPAGGVDPHELEKSIDERFHAYFRSHPSTAVLGPEDYAESAATLADWEQTEPGFASLQPNDSLVHIPYRREHSRYGHGAAIEAVERHFVDSSELAMRLLLRNASARERSTAGCAMLLMAWLICEPDLARLADRLSVGERPDGDAPFPISEPTPDQVGKAVALARQMRRLVASPRRHDAPGTLADWARSVEALRDALQDQVGLGALRPPAPGWEGPDGIATADREAAVLSIVDLCAHLVCNRLAVSLPEEISLRRLAGAAVAFLAEREG